MSLNVAYDLWQEIKRYIPQGDRQELADTFVNILIDHDHDAEEIRDTFKGDRDIKKILVQYMKDADTEENDYLENDLDDDDY